MSGAANLALAGLLHDLGKLYQRAYWGNAPEEVSDWSHPAYTEWAIGKWAHLFADNAGWLAHTAARHHEGWRDKPQYQPQTPEQWCVALADTYASRERKEVDEKGGHAPDTPLRSVFANLRVQKNYGQRDCGYNMVEAGQEVGLRLGGAYPQARSNVSRDTYWRLAERLDKRLAALVKLSPSPETLLSNLLGIFHELLWNVPSDTQGEPDVSLFDHLRLTGAIAAALWAYHDGKATVEELRDEKSEKFLLVLGDLGGIQGHIYRIQGARTGVGSLAKRLRARSLEVSLAAEAMGLELLQRTGFTPLQRIISAGGKFYLLLPNTPSVHQALGEVRQGWEEWALQQGATLLPFLAAHPFTPGGFRAFSQVLKAAHQKLAEAKQKPLSSQFATPDLTSGASLRPCTACGVRPARSATDELCHGCERDGHMGRLIPKRTEIGFFPQDASRPHYRFPAWRVALEGSSDYTLRTRPDFTPVAHPWEVRLLAGHIPTLDETLRQGCWRDLADYQAWAREQGLWEEEEEGRKADDPLTLAELAEFSTGAKYLGALMLDADRMGEAFATGFKDEKGQDSSSPSRMAALSRMLELFFAGEVPELIRNPQNYTKRLDWNDTKASEKARRYPLIYSVYAGGDDLFLLGPWDVLLDFALDLKRLYQGFTQHPKLTLSGGLVLVNPSLPIPLLAEAVQEAEQAAKAAGRDQLHLFGQSVPWSELPELVGWMQIFQRHLQAEGKEGMTSALAYRLLRLWKQHQEGGEVQRMRYKPLLAYALRERNDEIRTHYLQLTNHQGSAWRYLPVWLQWGLYLER